MARISNFAKLIAGAGALAGGYVKGQSLADEADKARREREMLDRLAGVNQDFTPRETQAASGQEALAAAQEAKANALAKSASEEEIAAIDSQYQPTLDALQARQAAPASVIASMGTGQNFQQRAGQFSEDEVQGAKSQARAGIYSAAGKEDDAARVLMNEQRRRTLADDAELRKVMDPGAPTGTPGGAVIDLADVTASDTIPGPTTVIRTQGVDDPIQRQKDGEASRAYYERKAPVIIDTLLKQGKLDEAKRYRDFIDSDKGRAYAEQWSRGVRKFAIGDHQGALNDWQSLYNAQLYDDGHTVKLTPIDDGKQVRADFFDNGGKQIRTFTQPIDALARQAGMALAPEKLVELRARQEETRQKEAASLDKSIQLETLRQQGQEFREDRRDARLAKQIEAGNARAASRGGLTTPQLRTNEEIDAARQMIAGLSDDEIRQRTTSTMASGRENPLYDGRLAAAVKLAGKRMYGDDPDFDARTGRQPEQAAAAKPAGTPIERARAAMAADPAMAGYSLGAQTMQGFKVLDKDGKHVGFYGAAR